MAKQSKSQIVKEWKSSEIKIKKDSKGLLWVILGKEKVKLPKGVTAKNISVKIAQDVLNGIELKEPNPVGAPTLYKDEYANQVYKLCLLGATDVELGDFFNVDKATINRWKNEFPEFCDSIKKGKEYADANVASKLYNRALGYEHEEDKIFNDQGVPLIVPTVKHYPPDTTAAIFWLKNRQPSKWREKQEVDHTTKGEKLESTPARILTKKEAQELYNSLENDY